MIYFFHIKGLVDIKFYLRRSLTLLKLKKYIGTFILLNYDSSDLTRYLNVIISLFLHTTCMQCGVNEYATWGKIFKMLFFYNTCTHHKK